MDRHLPVFVPTVISIFYIFLSRGERGINVLKRLAVILCLCLFSSLAARGQTYRFKNISKDTLVYCNEPIQLFPNLVLESDEEIPGININMAKEYRRGDLFFALNDRDSPIEGVMEKPNWLLDFIKLPAKDWAVFLRNVRFTINSNVVPEPGIRKIVLEIAGRPPSSYTTDTVIVDVRTISFDPKRDFTICKGDTVRLNRKDSFAAYLWSPSKTLSSATQSNPLASPPDTLIYKVVGKYKTCIDSAYFKVKVKPLPSVDFTVDSAKCYGYNLDACYIGDANVSSSLFTWVFGRDTISNAVGRSRETILLGTEETQRNLSLSVTQNGCSARKTLNSIRVIPDLHLTVPDSVKCAPFEAKFNAMNTEKVISYVWDFGDGTSEVSSGHTSHTYLDGGFYNVKLKVTTDNGCINEVIIDSLIHAAPIPQITFNLKPEECLGPGEQQLIYTGISDQKTHYNWDLSLVNAPEIIRNPGNTKGPLIFNMRDKFRTAIGLQVVTGYGCISPAGNISFGRKPNFSLTASSDSGCAPFDVDFTAITNDKDDVLSFYWDYGDGSKGSGIKSSHTYLNPDQKYAVALSALSGNSGCLDTLVNPGLIKTLPNPEAGFSWVYESVTNDRTNLNFSNRSWGAVRYLWDFKDGSSSPEMNPSHGWSGTGNRSVLLKVYNEYNCTDTISYSFLVAMNAIFPPNAFSPNASNPANREFRLFSEGVEEKGYHFVIFSRWNDIVFEAKDKIKGWDGRTKGGNWAPAGSYVWVLDFIDFLGRHHHQSGSVSLIY